MCAGEMCRLRRRAISYQELGELHVKAGLKPGTELVSKISEETGMSYR